MTARSIRSRCIDGNRRLPGLSPLPYAWRPSDTHACKRHRRNGSMHWTHSTQNNRCSMRRPRFETTSLRRTRTPGETPRRKKGRGSPCTPACRSCSPCSACRRNGIRIACPLFSAERMVSRHVEKTPDPGRDRVGSLRLSCRAQRAADGIMGSSRCNDGGDVRPRIAQ